MFIKIILRQLLKKKLYSAILLGSLSVGMAAVLVIALFLKTEWSFDDFHKKKDRIYRVTTTVKAPATGEIRHYATTMPPVAKSLRSEYPQIEEAVRFRRSDNHIISFNDKRFLENKVLFADTGFFRIFSFNLIAGNITTALQSPNSVVITKTIASKYFGDEDPLGKILRADSTNWQITGVIEDIPINSHFHPDFIVSFDTWKIPVGFPVTFESWTWVTFPTYILLKEGSSVAAIQQDLKHFAKKYGGEEIAAKRDFVLQPLKDVYFNGDLLGSDTFKSGSKKQSKVLAIIAAMILLIGGFNFMTLFTAASLQRVKEVGIRKVMGAERIKLVMQVSGEALLLSLLCVPAAMLITAMSVKWLSSIMDIPLVYASAQIFFSAAVSIAVSLLVGLVAGIYPAIKLTGFSPSITLRSLFRLPTGVSFKKGLVVTQFTISAILILVVVVMFKQSAFISKQSLGFEYTHLLNIKMPGEELEKRYEFIRNEIKKTGLVEEVSKSGNLFAEAIGSAPVFPDRTTNRDGSIQMNIHGVHYGFFETFGMQLKYGRFISNQFVSDSADAVVINEAAATAFGWKSDAVGRKLQIGEIKSGTVVGVVKDFNFRSLHTKVGPLVMYIPPSRLENIFIKTMPGKLTEVARIIEKNWPDIAGNIPLNLSFVDENIAALYNSDKKFMRLVFIMCFISVFLACMGLYALTMLIAGQRVKEIGIRKVLGASVTGVAFLLSRDFIKLIFISMMLACPVAWWAMNKWLDGYAYKITIDAGVFIVSFAFTVLLALITVSFQAIKAAIANPVKSLRTE